MKTRGNPIPSERCQCLTQWHTQNPEPWPRSRRRWRHGAAVASASRVAAASCTAAAAAAQDIEAVPDDNDGGRRDPHARRLRRDAVQRGPREALVGVRGALDDGDGRVVGVAERGEVRVEERQAAHGHEQHERATRLEGREGRERAAAVAPRRDEHLRTQVGVKLACPGERDGDPAPPPPCLAWFATPRCVMGMPARRGAARAEEMPGRTRGSKPCTQQPRAAARGQGGVAAPLSTSAHGSPTRLRSVEEHLLAAAAVQERVAHLGAAAGAQRQQGCSRGARYIGTE